MTTSNRLAEMRRTWYVWDMARHKKRVHPSTKARMRREFEDAVLAYAAEIEAGRIEAENMDEWRSQQ